MLSMDLKEAMAINVRLVRHAKGLTQEDLADRAGLSARYLGSIERAAVSASVTVLGQIAAALRVDACELIRAPRNAGKSVDPPVFSDSARKRNGISRRERRPFFDPTGIPRRVFLVPTFAIRNSQ